MAPSTYRFYENTSPYFVTCSIVGWIPVFIFRPATEIVLDSLRYLQDEEALRIHGYVIMENHLHLVITSSDPAHHLGRFKSFTARKIIDRLEENGRRSTLQLLETYKASHKTQRYQLWQEGVHPKQIVTDEMLRQKLEYMHNNPVKRGYVDEPEHWRHSSARNYLDREGVLNITRLL